MLSSEGNDKLNYTFALGLSEVRFSVLWDEVSNRPGANQHCNEF